MCISFRPGCSRSGLVQGRFGLKEEAKRTNRLLCRTYRLRSLRA
ncbi:hypothetical protein [Lysobacter gummosus]